MAICAKCTILPLSDLNMHAFLLWFSLMYDDTDEWESCSDEEDDDSDGSWIDVHHTSDEELPGVCLQEIERIIIRMK